MASEIVYDPFLAPVFCTKDMDALTLDIYSQFHKHRPDA